MGKPSSIPRPWTYEVQWTVTQTYATRVSIPWTTNTRDHEEYIRKNLADLATVTIPMSYDREVTHIEQIDGPEAKT